MPLSASVTGTSYGVYWLPCTSASSSASRRVTRVTAPRSKYSRPRSNPSGRASSLICASVGHAPRVIAPAFRSIPGFNKQSSTELRTGPPVTLRLAVAVLGLPEGLPLLQWLAGTFPQKMSAPQIRFHPSHRGPPFGVETPTRPSATLRAVPRRVIVPRRRERGRIFVREPQALACREEAGGSLCGGHNGRPKRRSHSPMRIVGNVAIVEVDGGIWFPIAPC